MEKGKRVHVLATSYNRLLRISVCYSGYVAGVSPFMILCDALDQWNIALTSQNADVRSVREDFEWQVRNRLELFTRTTGKTQMPASWLVEALKAIPITAENSLMGQQWRMMGQVPSWQPLQAAE